MAHSRSGERAEVVRIGTRGSELAMAQARELKWRLGEANPGRNLLIEIVTIETTGDKVQDRPLSEIGGKGLFTLEIEQQLHDGLIDMAVHSSKDMPTVLPEGLELSCFLPREAVADAFICPSCNSVEDLPASAVIGTSSLRRQALIQRMRPDIKIVTFRGNVQTRLRKLEEGTVDATILAQAGLNRLGYAGRITTVLQTDKFPPAPGQGAICVETRIGDAQTCELLSGVNHVETATALVCERAFLAGLDGSCRTPIAGYAQIHEERLHFHGLILTPDGVEAHELFVEGNVASAIEIGLEAAGKIRKDAGAAFFESWN